MAVNERFDLAPWELAPDSPEKLEGVASASIRATWLGKEREFLLREVEIAPEQFAVFAREVGASQGNNWTLYKTHHQDGNSFSWAVTCIFKTRSQNEIKLLRRAERSGLGRIFHVSFNATGMMELGRIFVTSRGQCHLHISPDVAVPDLKNNWEFFTEMNGFEEASADEWRQKVERELADPDSSARFALKWRQMSNEERAECIMRLTRGNIKQMQQVFSWGLQVFEPQLQEGYCCWDYLSNGELTLEDNTGGYETFEPSPTLIIWRDALLEWFGLNWNEDLVKRHPYVDDWVHENFEENFEASIESPTQHERLEAAIELRDWARGKVPDELLKTLL